MIKGLVEGKNYTDIADELGIDRRTLYRLRQKIEYSAFTNELVDRQFQEIEELSKDPKTRVEALKERGRMIRTAIPRRLESKIQRQEVKVILTDPHKPPSAATA